MGFGFLGGFRVNLHRGADVLVTHDVLNDLQVGLIFAQPGAERVPEIMAGERRQQEKGNRMDRLVKGCIRKWVHGFLNGQPELSTAEEVNVKNMEAFL